MSLHPGAGGRVVAVWPHATRPEAMSTSGAFVAELAKRGIGCIAVAEEVEVLRAASGGIEIGTVEDFEGHCELSVIFGGDGTILRAAEWAVPRDVPLLGVNMGHVGFLAELEYSELGTLVEHVVGADYQVEERLTVQIDVRDSHGEVVWSSSAVNEMSVEKHSRERMVELLVSIDGRPLARWSSDGVLVSTPTGSTAYAFSAGGPVIWPDVEALLVVPISAHALFARAVVVSPKSRVDIQLVNEADTLAVVWCDGRRTTTLRPGMTGTVTPGAHPMRVARLKEQPFTNRLVRKFGLRVEGWRGGPAAGPQPEPPRG